MSSLAFLNDEIANLIYGICAAGAVLVLTLRYIAKKRMKKDFEKFENILKNNKKENSK